MKTIRSTVFKENLCPLLAMEFETDTSDYVHFPFSGWIGSSLWRNFSAACSHVLVKTYNFL